MEEWAGMDFGGDGWAFEWDRPGLSKRSHVWFPKTATTVLCGGYWSRNGVHRSLGIAYFHLFTVQIGNANPFTFSNFCQACWWYQRCTLSLVGNVEATQEGKTNSSPPGHHSSPFVRLRHRFCWRRRSTASHGSHDWSVRWHIYPQPTLVLRFSVTIIH